MSRGSLFIISAPSGAGKTTVLKKAMESLPRLAFAVSHTTRPQRLGENDGEDYHFVSKENFGRLRQEDEFLEWAEVHGNLYGTGRQQVENQLQKGDVILDIDVQGAKQIRNSKMVNNHFIFIIPPSMEELARRLIGRKTEPSNVIQLRLANAKRELAAAPLYDYVVVNDNLNAAVDMLRAIIITERSRTRRDAEGKPLFILVEND